MYYIWSLFVTCLIFGAIQYKEYQNDNDKYYLWTVGNLSTFVIIYLLATIAFYMLLGIDYDCIKKISKVKKTGGDVKTSDIHIIDPVMLRRIPDHMYVGFDPNAMGAMGDDV